MDLCDIQTLRSQTEKTKQGDEVGEWCGRVRVEKSRKPDRKDWPVGQTQLRSQVGKTGVLGSDRT